MKQDAYIGYVDPFGISRSGSEDRDRVVCEDSVRGVSVVPHVVFPTDREVENGERITAGVLSKRPFSCCCDEFERSLPSA